MGACYVDNFIEDKETPISESQLQDIFQEDQETDRYENGHMYSGGIGMAEGLRIDHSKKFGSVQEAQDWVDKNADKWGPAIAVRVEGPNDKGWYYGAICAS